MLTLSHLHVEAYVYICLHMVYFCGWHVGILDLKRTCPSKPLECPCNFEHIFGICNQCRFWSTSRWLQSQVFASSTSTFFLTPPKISLKSTQNTSVFVLLLCRNRDTCRTSALTSCGRNSSTKLVYSVSARCGRILVPGFTQKCGKKPYPAALR